MAHRRNGSTDQEVTAIGNQIENRAHRRIHLVQLRFSKSPLQKITRHLNARIIVETINMLMIKLLQYNLLNKNTVTHLN